MSTWTESRSLFQWLYWTDFLTGLAQVGTDFQWEGMPLLAIAASGLKFFLSTSPFPCILFHSSSLPSNTALLRSLICSIKIHSWYSDKCENCDVKLFCEMGSTRSNSLLPECFLYPTCAPRNNFWVPQGEEKDMVKPMISKSNHQLLALAENSSNWNMQE